MVCKIADPANPSCWKLHYVAMATIGVSVFIAFLILTIGYKPYVLTSSSYVKGECQIIGYGTTGTYCSYKCNCRWICMLKPRPGKPCDPLDQAWRCDECLNPCVYAWVVYQFLDRTHFSFVFDAYKTKGDNPLPGLQNQYPPNSTTLCYVDPNYLNAVYGDELTKVINCFIAGFVFLGIVLAMLLAELCWIMTFCCVRKFSLRYKDVVTL